MLQLTNHVMKTQPREITPDDLPNKEDHDRKYGRIKTENHIYSATIAGKGPAKHLVNDVMSIAIPENPGSFPEQGHLVYVPCIRCTLFYHCKSETTSNANVFKCGNHIYINHWVFFRCSQCPNGSNSLDCYNTYQMTIPCPLPYLLRISNFYIEHNKICTGGSRCSHLLANPNDYQCCNDVAFSKTSIEKSLYPKTIKTTLETLPAVDLPTKIHHSSHDCAIDGCIDYQILMETLNNVSCQLTGDMWVGSFTRIFKAVNLHNKEALCIKAVCLHHYKNTVCHSVDTELTLFKQMNDKDKTNEDVLSLLGAFRLEDTVYTVSYLQENGSLMEYLTRVGYLSEFEYISMVEEICCGISFLHSRNIAHRNLTLENILVGKNGKLKIAGFGSSCFVAPDRYMNYPFVTYTYAAPELFQTRSFDPLKPDIWALGIISYYLFKREHLFPDSCIRSQSYWPLKQWNHTELSRNFIEHLLNRDFIQRPNISSVLTHSWFSLALYEIYSVKKKYTNSFEGGKKIIVKN
ncbi:uncharacterized protein LOC128250689 [Octopus bimaculoides]|uniref:Protein kinase domain-containing protein n=1 Tax=Octopus bimaculoides TaxID=37653 RepID=A0A0L8FUT2_OCTBM|nr:uncharacterized protein LOC128250689 [Octopus bimaculoides]